MGGHGGLNILPQKKWNVYNMENKLRVERDELCDKQRKRDDESSKRTSDFDNRISLLKRKRIDVDEVPNTKRIPTKLGSSLCPTTSTEIERTSSTSKPGDVQSTSKQGDVQSTSIPTTTARDKSSPKRSHKQHKKNKDVTITAETGHINFFQELEDFELKNKNDLKLRIDKQKRNNELAGVDKRYKNTVSEFDLINRDIPWWLSVENSIVKNSDREICEQLKNTTDDPRNVRISEMPCDEQHRRRKHKHRHHKQEDSIESLRARRMERERVERRRANELLR